MVKNRLRLNKILKYIRFILLSFVVLVFFLPIISMIVTSLKSMAELYRIPPKILPDKPIWENYNIAWDMINYGRYLLNSIILSVLYTIPVIIGSCFTGYGYKG